MTNPTSNYGFVLPTATDLVTDLPADFDVALQGVDTRLKALNPETTLGDLSYGSATANTNTRLGIGSTGQVLTVAAGVPSWATPTDQTPLTTKGDLFTYSTTDARLGVGTNGQVLKANSATATGLEWGSAAAPLVWSLISTTSMSGSSTVTLSGLNYKNLRLFVDSAKSATSNVTFVIRPNGNASDYINIYQSLGTPASYSPLSIYGAYGNLAGISLASTGSSTATTISGYVDFSSADQTTGFKPYQSMGFPSYLAGATDRFSYAQTGLFTAAVAITSIDVLAGGGTFNAGTLRLYGAN